MLTNYINSDGSEHLLPRLRLNLNSARLQHLLAITHYLVAGDAAITRLMRKNYGESNLIISETKNRGKNKCKRIENVCF